MSLDWPTAAVLITALSGIIVGFLRLYPRQGDNHPTSTEETHKMNRELASLQATLTGLQRDIEQLQRELSEIRKVLLKWVRGNQ